MSNENKYLDLYLTLDNSNTLQAVKDFETYETIPIENLKIYAGNYVKIHLAAELDDSNLMFTSIYYIIQQDEITYETLKFIKSTNPIFKSEVYNVFGEQELINFQSFSPGIFNLSIHKFIGDIEDIGETGDGETLVGISNPLPIEVLPSSASARSMTIPNGESTNHFNQLIAQLETMINGGKLIKELSFGSNMKANDPFALYVKYTNSNEFEYVGNAYPSLEDLGLLVGRNGTKKGGGKVGEETRLYGNMSGFAGGYSAKARTGGAVGDKAAAYQGFAGGEYARNIQATDGISIGKDSYVYRNILNDKKKKYDEEDTDFENGSIAIGTKAKVLERKNAQRSNVAIGDHAVVTSGNRSISIGAYNAEIYDEKNKKTYVRSKDRQVLYSSTTLVAESSNAIAIGPEAYVRFSNDSISIGTNAMVYSTKIGQTVYTVNKQGKKTEHEHTLGKNYLTNYSIAIGSDSLCKSKASIAIGYKAEVGTADNGMALYGNYMEDTKQDTENPAGAVSAIAIGYNTKARRNSSVAIGKQADARQYGCIAIGKLARAGGTYIHRTRTQEEKSGTPRAIAIGVGAEALKKDAVQIGQGTNNTENSLQFRNVVIVKDGCVQNDLTQGQKGSLPIKNGGTGASSRNQARRNLGIYAGEELIKFSTDNGDLDGNNGRGITLKIPFKNQFKTKIPTVVATLAFGAGEEDLKNPKFHSLIVTEVTKEYFVVKYNYTGQLKKNEVEALKPRVNYVLIYV